MYLGAQVRNTILRLLGQLPVDCSFEDRKEQLKKSGLGKVVMFLYMLPGACNQQQCAPAHGCFAVWCTDHPPALPHR